MESSDIPSHFHPYAPICFNDERMGKEGFVYDVVIIGGGIVGVCLARQFSMYKGVKTLLLEKGIELAMGATKANSGIVHAEGHADVQLLKGQFLIEGNNMFDTLAKELCFGYRTVGEYLIALNEEEEKCLKGLYSQCIERKINCMFVEHEKLMEMEPNINPNAKCGIYYPNAKSINPYEATMQIGLCAARNGVHIGLGREVIGISPVNIRSDLNEREYKIKARLTEAPWFYPEHKHLFERKNEENNYSRITVEYRSKIIINCAGIYGDKISQSFISSLYNEDPDKYPSILDYFISPRKGQEFLLNTNIFNSIIFPTPNVHTKGVLIIPTADGNTMIGPTAEDVDINYSELLKETEPEKLPKIIQNLIYKAKINTGTTGAGFNTVFNSVTRLGKEDIMKNAKSTYFGTFAGNRSVIKSLSNILALSEGSKDSLLSRELSKYNYLPGTENVRNVPSFKKELFEGDITNMKPLDNDFLIRSLFFEDYIEFVGIQSPGLTSGPSLGQYGARLAINILKKKNKENCGYSLKDYNSLENEKAMIKRNKSLDIHSKEFNYSSFFNQELNECNSVFHPYIPPIKIRSEFGDAHKHLMIDDIENEENICEENPIICKCESISYNSIISAIRHGARSLDGLKHRTRQGMGVCQGGFCGPRVIGILAEELKKIYDELNVDKIKNEKETIMENSFIPAVTKCGNGSYLIAGGFKADRKPTLTKFPNFNDILKDEYDDKSKQPIKATCEDENDQNINISIIGGGPAGIGALLGILGSVEENNKLLIMNKERGDKDRSNNNNNNNNNISKSLHFTIHIFDRNPSPGGILIQCIHSGFGLKKFHKELTGPEYGESLWNLVKEKIENIKKQNEILENISVHATVIPHFGSFVENCFYNKDYEISNKRYMIRYKNIKGVSEELYSSYLMLCSGSRERPPSSIFLWNTTRSISGVYTAGQLQRMLNNEGYSINGIETGTKSYSTDISGNDDIDLYGFQHSNKNVYNPQHPFKCVVLGSGDIGLIMVRRLKYNFAEVYEKTKKDGGDEIEDPFSSIHINVYEIKPTISGLRRNVLTCCTDNNVSIRCNTTVIGVKSIENGTEINEDLEDCYNNSMKPLRRISAVTLKDFSTGEVWDEECNLLILSVGLQQDVEVNTRASINECLKDDKSKLIPVRSLINFVPPIAPIVTPSLSVNINDYFEKLGKGNDGIVAHHSLSKDDNQSLFICGNSLHIHDLADSANSEGERVGRSLGELVIEKYNDADKALGSNNSTKKEVSLKPVSLDGLLYLIPRELPLEVYDEVDNTTFQNITISFRVLQPMAFCDIVLSVVVEGDKYKVEENGQAVERKRDMEIEVTRIKRTNVEPAEMEVIPVPPSVFEKASKLIKEYLKNEKESTHINDNVTSTTTTTSSSSPSSPNIHYKIQVIETGKRIIPEGATVLTCITCPNGCTLVAEDAQKEGIPDMESFLSKGTPILDKRFVVTGNKCPRGIVYATTELSAPVRQFSLSVNVPNIGMVPIKPRNPVSKSIIEKVISYITRCELDGVFNRLDSGSSSVSMGDVLLCVPSIDGHNPVEMLVCRSVGN